MATTNEGKCGLLRSKCHLTQLNTVRQWRSSTESSNESGQNQPQPKRFSSDGRQPQLSGSSSHSPRTKSKYTPSNFNFSDQLPSALRNDKQIVAKRNCANKEKLRDARPPEQHFVVQLHSEICYLSWPCLNFPTLYSLHDLIDTNQAHLSHDSDSTLQQHHSNDSAELKLIEPSNALNNKHPTD